MSVGVRVVFDCVVFLQAVARASGPAGRCLDLLKESAFQLVICDAILRGIRNVLGRPKVRARNPAITDAAVDELLAYIHKVSHHVADPPYHFPMPRDPKDEVYLNLAIETGARYLVTRDKDLLDLMRPDTAGGQNFLARFPALTILDPVAFLAAMTPTP